MIETPFNPALITMTFRLSIPVAIANLFLALAAPVALATSPPPLGNPAANPNNLAVMREALAQGWPDWTVVHDTIRTKQMGTEATRYWLVTLQPKQPGQFTLRYTFYRSGDAYPYGDREYAVNAGTAGCERVWFREQFFPDLCLGDRVVIPIEIRQGSSHYAFGRRSRFATEKPNYLRLPKEYPKLNPAEAPLQASIPSPPSYFRYLGRTTIGRGGGSTAGGDLPVPFSTLLAAQKVGSLFLTIRLNPSPGLVQRLQQQKQRDERQNRPDFDPFMGTVIIKAKSEPVTVLPLQETNNDYEITDNRRFYRYRSKGFSVETIQARVGDRLWFDYGHIWLHLQGREFRDFTTQILPLLNQSVPEIIEQPLSAKPAKTTIQDFYTFDDWLTP